MTGHEERAAIVAWLRSGGAVPKYMMDLHDADDIADQIERGDHMEPKP